MVSIRDLNFSSFPVSSLNRSQETTTMQRRDFIQASAATVFGAHLPFSGAYAQNRYAKYAGQTVTLSIPSHPHYDAMLKILPEFTKETGIKVETDRLAIGRMKEKQLLEMAKPKGDYDLCCYVVMWKTEYVSKNLVHELEPFFRMRRWQTPITTSRTSQRLLGRTRCQTVRPALRRRDFGAGVPQ
jgi:hypothetical protein